MGFPFAWVCDLLDELEKLMVRSAPLLPRILKTEVNAKTISWLQSHRQRLDANNTDADVVILAFRLETRADRDYGLDSRSLEQVIARVSNLPKKHAQELQRWRHVPPAEDLPACVERVLENMNDSKERIVSPSEVNDVTVEEIDHVLLEIAAHNEGSSPEVRDTRKYAQYDIIAALGSVYRRLRSREAKWLTRLILKDFRGIKFPDELTCGPNNRALPQCVLVEAKFKSSMPESERRDGPGRMRLGAAAKAYSNRPPTPPPTAPEPLSLAITIAPISYSPALGNNTPTRIPPQFQGASESRLPILASSPLRQKSPSKLRRILPRQKRCSSKHLTPQRISPESPSRGTVRARNWGHIHASSMLLSGGGECQLTDARCPLANCIFLLAPCILNIPWITERLLRWHGSYYVRSPEVFAHPNILGSCPTGKTYQRIILVEPRKMEQTVDFLRQVERLTSAKRGVHKPSIDVYDWRILECIAKVDRGQELAHKSRNKYRMCEI